MTGIEAFNKIKPYIDPMEHPEFNNKEMAEAFCMCFIAAQKYDRRHKEWRRYKKCKQCKWLTGEKKVIGIECMNPVKHFRSHTAHYKQPTGLACKLFEPKKENE